MSSQENAPQLLEKESIYKHEFQNLAIMLLLTQKRYKSHVLVMKKDRFVLRQTWIAEIGCIVKQLIRICIFGSPAFSVVSFPYTSRIA